MKLSLTERDLALFEALNDFGILSTKQLRKHIFTKVDRCTVHRRLRRLKKAKYIQAISGLPRGEFCWLLALKGARRIGSDLVVKNVNKNLLDHDILASDIRFSLDGLKMATGWKSGHLLRAQMNRELNPYQRCQDTIPDWLVSIHTNQGWRVMALEVELTLKSKSRMESVLSLYSQKKAIKHLWYVVPSERFGQKLMGFVNKMYPRPATDWFLWSTVSEILNHPSKAKVHFNGGQMELNRMCKLPMEEKEMTN